MVPFLGFQMIWRSPYKKIIYGVKFCTHIWTPLKNGVNEPFFEFSATSKKGRKRCNPKCIYSMIFQHVPIIYLHLSKLKNLFFSLQELAPLRGSLVPAFRPEILQSFNPSPPQLPRPDPLRLSPRRLMPKAPFFRWMSLFQKIIGYLGVILKIRDVEIGWSFLENYWKKKLNRLRSLFFSRPQN